MGFWDVFLLDCDVKLVLPLPGTLPNSSDATLRQTTAHAVKSRAQERSECYIGEAVHLVVVIQGPPVEKYGVEPLRRVVEVLEKAEVSVKPEEDGNSSDEDGKEAEYGHRKGLPVLQDSGWFHIGEEGANEEKRMIFCRGLRVLIRRIPSQSKYSDLLALLGKSSLVVTVREVVKLDISRENVEETVGLAARLSGPINMIEAKRSVTVSLPLELRCKCLSVANNASRVFAVMSARNLTNDSNLYIIPPDIRLASTRLVGMSGMEDVSVVSSSYDSSFVSEAYEFIPQFGGPKEQEESKGDPAAVDLLDAVSFADFDLVPRCNSLLRRAIALRPREGYEFVYAIRPRISRLESAALGNRAIPRFQSGCHLETDVLVSWTTCSQSDDSISSLKTGDESDSGKASSGDVKRSSEHTFGLATRLLTIDWRPPELLEDILMRFSGPQIVARGEAFDVTVTILNQSRTDVGHAMLLVQKKRPRAKRQRLLPLRTTTFLGPIAAGATVSVKLKCIAYFQGTMRLGDVRLVDMTPREYNERNMWATDVSFETFATEKDSPDWKHFIANRSSCVSTR